MSEQESNRPRADHVPAAHVGIAALRAWFRRQGWTPFGFQEEAWAAWLAGESGLVNVPTGTGKTWAAFGGPLAHLVAEHHAARSGDAGTLDGAAATNAAGTGEGTGLRVLYLSPLRAVGRDMEQAFARVVADLDLPVRVEARTGDTPQRVRTLQRRRLPEILITTPESLALLLSWDDAPERFAALDAIILDEWHELVASKRGALLELLLARLRGMAPTARTWALSATIANLADACQAAVGVGQRGRIVRQAIDRTVHVTTLLPASADALPLAGHLGLRMLDALVDALDPAQSTLVFTNTRSQAERWFAAIALRRPEWLEFMGLHHGSLARGDREAVEAGLRSGDLRLVVCTSSLDLGVDFGPVERVVQVGSARGIARLLQRAGRSGHRPGAASVVMSVPTHALELLELAALRDAVRRGEVEPRESLDRPLDVLAQHLVTCALGGGFHPESLWAEVRTAYAYRHLTRDEFAWTLDLVAAGGETLKAYPEFQRLATVRGRVQVVRDEVAQLHRMNIGTIVSDLSLRVVLGNGQTLGTVEESFLARLSPGQSFVFSGRTLSLVRIDGDRAVCRVSRDRTTLSPRWGGGRLPMSDSLGRAMRSLLGQVAADELGVTLTDEERALLVPILALQRERSAIPAADELLIETCETREGWHLFLHPFEGVLVHEGLGALLALRLGRLQPLTLTVAASDYGIELLANEPVDWKRLVTRDLFSTDALIDDAMESVNSAELAKRQFREVARVANLVPQNRPGSRVAPRHLQSSAGLIWEVFRRHDPGNLLVLQATREVLERQFEHVRMARTLDRLRVAPWVWRDTPLPSPLAFPLVIERVAGRISTEALASRVERMVREFGLPVGAGGDPDLAVSYDAGSREPREARARAREPSNSTSGPWERVDNDNIDD